MTPPTDRELAETIDGFWHQSVLPQFERYVEIPCISPSYDPDWKEQGYLAQAATLAEDWIGGLTALGAELHTGPDDGAAPPILLFHFPANPPGTPGSVLTYGHFDKQTVLGEEGEWTEPPGAENRGPFVPNVYQDHLYGRGTSDDGFATFTIVAALWAMAEKGLPYPAVNVIVDFDEESGSENLASSLEAFAGVIGQPDLCIELDSSIGDYQRLWASPTARGTITGTLSVQVLSTAVHSGDGGGIVPNPVNLLRLLLDRIEDAATGEVVIPEFRVPVPAAHLADVQAQAAALGAHLIGDFPWVGGAYPYAQDPVELVLAKTWRAALALTGQSGLPSLARASNVIVPEIEVQLSMRLPPPVDVDAAQQVLQRTLEKDPPFGATVRYDYEGAPIGAGWVSPPRARWFADALASASRDVFGQDVAPSGDGGTIPVLNLMSECYPGAQILATGCAGPGNHEHGANENLDMGYARKLALALTKVLGATTRNAGTPGAG